MNKKAHTRASFEQFVRDRSTGLAQTAYLLTSDLHHAQDLLQTALAKAATRWDRLDDAEAYVRRVLYTQAVSRWRRLGRRPAETLTDSPPHRGVHGIDVETRLVLRQALGRLTPRQRAVLVLRFYEDRTEVETARMLGCAVGTVKSQTRAALRRLRALSPELVDLVNDRPGAEAPHEPRTPQHPARHDAPDNHTRKERSADDSPTAARTSQDSGRDARDHHPARPL